MPYRSERIDEHCGIINSETHIGRVHEKRHFAPILRATHRTHDLPFPRHRDAEQPLPSKAVHLNTRHVFVRTVGIDMLPVVRRRDSPVFDMDHKERRGIGRYTERSIVRQLCELLVGCFDSEYMVAYLVMERHN